AARDKALTDFNRAKAEKLEATNADGKRLKELKVSTENNLRIVTESLNTAKGYLSDMEQKEAALKADIDHVTRGAMPVESTTECYQLSAKHRDIQDEIRKLEADSSIAATAIQKEMADLA